MKILCLLAVIMTAISWTKSHVTSQTWRQNHLRLEEILSISILAYCFIIITDIMHKKLPEFIKNISFPNLVADF